MPEITERLTQNATGSYYVDSSCVDCDFCRSVAPAIFKRDEELGMSVVHHQPVTLEEVSAAEDAREGCPTDSIGRMQALPIP
jgi:ferredoxin